MLFRSVTGTPNVGTVLTGVLGTYTDADGDVAGTHLYQWYLADDASGANRTAIAGATAITYTVKGADQGRHVVFEVTPVSATGRPAQGTPVSGVTPTSAKGTAPSMTAPTITGEHAVGFVLTGVDGTYSDADNDTAGTHLYAWYRADDAAGTNRVHLAGTKQYTVAAADVGKFLIFEVTPRSLTGDPTAGTPVQVATPGVVELPGQAPAFTSVAITGVPGTGLVTNTVLTAAPQGYSDANSDAEGTHRYQWYRATDAAGTNVTAISGATGATYTVKGADQGNYLVVDATPVSATGLPSAGNPVRGVGPIVQGQVPSIASVTLAGSAFAGQTISGTAVGYTDPDGDVAGAHQYQWFLATDALGNSRTPISGATSSTYVIQNGDVGNYLMLQITPVSATGMAGTRVGSTESAVMADAIQLPGLPPSFSSVDITGVPGSGPMVAAVLTAVPQGYNDPNGDAQGTHEYQWYRTSNASGGNPVAIAGATGASYTVQGTDQGFHVAVDAIPVSATGMPNKGNAVRRVVATMVTGTAPSLTSVNIGVTGSGVGATFLATGVGYADADNDAQGTTLYQWFRADDAAGTHRTAIAGATNANYVATAADVGRFLIARVTPVSLTGTPNTGDAREATRGVPAPRSTYSNDTDTPFVKNAMMYEISTITVTGRPGTGPVDAVVKVTLNATVTNAKLFLYNPSNARYISVTPTEFNGEINLVDETFTVDLSGDTLNGDWSLVIGEISATAEGTLDAWSITF